MKVRRSETAVTVGPVTVSLADLRGVIRRSGNWIGKDLKVWIKVPVPPQDLERLAVGENQLQAGGMRRALLSARAPGHVKRTASGH